MTKKRIIKCFQLGGANEPNAVSIYFLSESYSFLHQGLAHLLHCQSGKLEISDAEMAVREEYYQDFRRLRLPCGAGVQNIGSVYSGRKGKGGGREKFYIATEFDNQEETMEAGILDVYYGRVLIILQYNFKVYGEILSRFLFAGECVGSLKKPALGQVYKLGPRKGSGNEALKMPQ